MDEEGRVKGQESPLPDAPGPKLKPNVKPLYMQPAIFAVLIFSLIMVAVVVYAVVESLQQEGDDGNGDGSTVTGDGTRKDVTDSSAKIDIITISGGPKPMAEFSAHLVNGSGGSTVSMGNVSTTAEVEGYITLEFNDLNGDGYLNGIDTFTITGLEPNTEYTFTLEWEGQEIFSEEFTTLSA